MTLRDLYKKHHWQVSGPIFNQLHLLFDKHFQEQSGLVDLLAERIQTLGGVSIAMAHDVAKMWAHSWGACFMLMNWCYLNPARWPGKQVKMVMKEQMASWSVTLFEPMSFRSGLHRNIWWRRFLLPNGTPPLVQVTVVQSDAERAAALALAANASGQVNAANARANKAEHEKAVLRAQLFQQLNLILQTQDTARGPLLICPTHFFSPEAPNLEPPFARSWPKLPGLSR